MATAKTGAAASLTDIGRMKARPDPILEFRWVVSGDIPFATGTFTDPYDGGTYNYAIDYTYIETVNLPFNNVASQDVFCGSGYTVFPGNHKIGGFSLNVYADIAGNSMKWLQAWKSKVKNFETGTYGLPKDYKRNLQVQLLDNKGNVIITYTLIRAWPEATQDLNLTNDGQGRLVYAQSFALDDAKISFAK